MAVGCFEALLIVLFGNTVFSLNLQIDDAIDELGVGFVNQKFKDWSAIERAFMHCDLIKLKVS